MKEKEKDQRRVVAVSAVIEAGEYLSSMFGEAVSFQEKDYLDFASGVDKGSEAMIVYDIKANFPDDGILAEEAGEQEGKTGFRWILDSLDGTHNFLSGLKQFGILLALEWSGEVILGICSFPLLEEFFITGKDKGAFCNKKKIQVSQSPNLRGQMFCPDGIMRKKPKEILKDIEKFCGAGCRFRVYGSTPFSFTRVALGQAVIATNRAGKPWDIAAPALLVEEAGGKVTDEKGNPWSIHSENLIATNGIIHDRSLALFNEI